MTLIEMVLALTILSLAGTILYSSLSTALHSWSTGLDSGRRGHVARIALSRISEQLRSSIPSKIKKEGRDVVAFDGGDDYIRFVTLLPASPSVLAQVSYRMVDTAEGKALLYSEHPWPDKKFFDESEPSAEEKVPEIDGLSIVMKGKKESQSSLTDEEELEEWNPGESENPPVMVEVTLTSSAGEGSEQESYKTVVFLPAQPRE